MVIQVHYMNVLKTPSCHVSTWLVQYAWSVHFYDLPLIIISCFVWWNVLFNFREYREHVKDLSCLSKDLCRTVIVDNNPFSFLLQPMNGIPCIPFSAGQPHDDQVLTTKKYLHLYLSFVQLSRICVRIFSSSNIWKSLPVAKIQTLDLLVRNKDFNRLK